MPLLGWDSAQLEECLLGVHNALGLITSTTYPGPGGARLSSKHLGGS